MPNDSGANIMKSHLNAVSFRLLFDSVETKKGKNEAKLANIAQVMESAALPYLCVAPRNRDVSVLVPAGAPSSKVRISSDSLGLLLLVR